MADRIDNISDKSFNWFIKLRSMSGSSEEFILKKHALIIFFLFGLIVYSPVFFSGFQTLWDDQWVVMNSYTEGGLNWQNIQRIFTEYYEGQYAPFNQLYYSMLYTLFGYNSFVFHTASVSLHIANCILVYEFILTLLRARESRISGYTYNLAFLASVLFLIHPVSVEAAAWISASKVLLYTFFYLLALLSYLRYVRTAESKYYIITLLLFLFSFGSKEQAVTLPLCLLLIDLVVRKKRNKTLIYLEKVPFLLLAILFGVVTIYSQAAENQGIIGSKDHYPIYQRIVFASYALFEYLTKSFIPFNLSYVYPFPNRIGEPLPLRFWLYPVTFIIIGISGWRYAKQPWYLFWIGFFILHLFITLHIIPIARHTITADRYMYLALIAPCYSISYIILRLAEQSRTKKYLLPAVLCYILLLGGYAHFRSKVWHDSDTLKQKLKNITESQDHSS